MQRKREHEAQRKGNEAAGKQGKQLLTSWRDQTGATDGDRRWILRLPSCRTAQLQDCPVAGERRLIAGGSMCT